jgi:hypothetical protein
MVPKSFLDAKTIVSVDDYGFDGNMLLDDGLVTFLGLWIADGSYSKNANGTLNGLKISTGNDKKIIDWLNDFINSDPLYYPWVTLAF